MKFEIVGAFSTALLNVMTTPPALLVPVALFFICFSITALAASVGSPLLKLTIVPCEKPDLRLFKWKLSISISDSIAAIAPI